MVSHTPGKIFLADQRGLAETSQFRRYCTFSFGDYAHPHKGPFGRLYGLNEETLAGAHRLALPVGQASYVLLLPITGALEARAGSLAPATVEVEQALLLALPAGSVLHLTNPYETDLISFLHLWLAAPTAPPALSQQLYSFSLQGIENKLAEVVPAEASRGFSLSLGRFAGRAEAFYHLRHASAQFFTFVLAGAFEIEGRLLHERDALALWDLATVELEALSNSAIVLVLEWQ